MELKGTDWGGSRLKAFQRCKRLYYLKYLKGVERVEVSEPLSWGHAIHAGLFHFYQNLEEARKRSQIEQLIAESIHAAVNLDQRPDPERELFTDSVISCLDQYFTHYQREIYDPSHGMQPVAAEVPISLQVGSFTHTGRLDLLATFAGHLCIPDHKTTSMDWARFFRRWKLDLSLRGYVLAYYKHTGKLLSVLINGIRRRNDKAMTCEFQRDLIHFSEREMEETEYEIADIRRDIASRDPSRAIEWPKTGESCQGLFECEMRSYCLHPEADLLSYRERSEKEE